MSRMRCFHQSSRPRTSPTFSLSTCRERAVIDGAGREDAPILRTRRVALQHIEPRHYDFLFSYAVRDEQNWRWNGRPVGPEAFRESLWDRVHAQFVVARTDGAPVGVVRAYGANFHHRYVYVQVGFVDSEVRFGTTMEATALFVNYLFERWDFRKLYAEVTDSYPAFAAGAEKYFDVEGRLRDHIFINGRYRDLLILSIRRERWLEYRDRFLRIAGPRCESKTQSAAWNL